jgi:hypothetical protein
LPLALSCLQILAIFAVDNRGVINMKPATRITLFLSLGLVSNLLFCQQADAAVVTYTNRTTWSNTVKDNVLDTFSDLTGTTLPATLARPGYSVSSTTIFSVGTLLRTGNTPAVTTRPFLTANSTVAQTFTLNFAAPRTAFGVDAFVTSLNILTGARNLTAGNIIVTVDGVSLTRATNGPTFFGFTSDTPFSQVTIQKTAGGLLTNVLSIENVELATAVPEPSAVATTGLIAVAAIFAARRRRAAANSAVVTSATHV